MVEIYSGELLPEDRFEEWSVGPRDEARARFSAAGHRLAAAALAEGDLETASSVARRLIESDRYDEGAHETLVRALALGDAAGEARLAHSRWAEALAELDVSIAPYAELGLSQDDAAMRPTEP